MTPSAAKTSERQRGPCNFLRWREGSRFFLAFLPI
jgi:hypothetical protein